MNALTTVKDYFKFATAREFWHSSLEEGSFVYEKTTTEKIGDILVMPIFKNSDSLLKRIREPYMITAMTLAALGLTTLLFYPEETMSSINRVIPVSSMINPKTVKFALFLASELTILGFGARTVGRLSNTTLMNGWNDKTVMAIPLGAVIR